MAEAAKDGVEIIPVQVDLRNKARPVPAFKQKVDPVEAAEQAVDKLSFQFKNWMTSEVDTLNDTWKNIKTDGINDETYEGLFRAAHDIRGQAETLGYPLAGHVATSLCLLMEAVAKPEGLPLPLMEKHIQSLYAIVHEKAEEEHPIGKELVAALRAVTEDYIGNLAAG